ncbi:PLP-dependent aminotransferase family protein [Paenibacillus sp. N3.4]|uniref:aminotransferase-like domain-containing protein n=1 Tax=Paenibacillus sp. N3.4 TaxID=2603222 RepID=UPI0011CA2C32|nr:PLP-dependent aminotransferase family protein [Paenibacillus sp. N3.4]TXK76953.1 PLP-dependent aminotransferase family protein [Paenibacillus sp. N3.4]
MPNALNALSFAKRIPSTPSIGSTTVTRLDHVHLSFGFAAPDLFPIEELDKAASQAVTLRGKAALQYSGGDGPRKIVDWIINRSKHHGIAAEKENILVTYGATQGISVAANAIVDPGDHVWVESPSFFGALQAFRVAEATITSFSVDEHGLRVDLLEEALKLARETNQPLPKLFYTMPTFHNPTGATLSLERRKKLVALAREYQFWILEDDAYMELNFSGEVHQPLYTLAPERVIYFGTFSKIIAPGVRLGWIIADKAAINNFRLLLLGGSIGVLTQEILAQLLDNITFEDHLDKLITHYRNQRDVMAKAIERHLGGLVTYHLPEGGFFIWLKFEEHINASQFLRFAEERGVSFVDGRSFEVKPVGLNNARLCFSYVNEEAIERGVKTFADAFHDYVKEHHTYKHWQL